MTFKHLAIVGTLIVIVAGSTYVYYHTQIPTPNTISNEPTNTSTPSASNTSKLTSSKAGETPATSLPQQVPTTSASSTTSLSSSSKTKTSGLSVPATSSTPTTTSLSYLPPTTFVTRQSTHFMDQGKPFTFVGVNRYNAAGDDTIFTCGDSGENMDTFLDTMFGSLRSHIKGNIVVRFWAFQSYTKDGTRWDGIDRVIRYAKKYNVRLIPVLENHWADCTQGGTKTNDWYTSAYDAPYGSYSLSYKNYVRTIVSRYKNEPTIFAWSLMNEAETPPSDQTTDAPLATFSSDISAYIKSIDSNHLVTLGTLANEGQAGTNGDKYSIIYGPDTIDFAEVHDYNFPDKELPGATGATLPATCQSWESSIACNMYRALNILHKPIIVGEVGIDADSSSLQTRADYVDAKMHAFFANGGSGYLIWHWALQSQGLDMSDTDPLNDVLNTYSVQ